MGIESPGQKVLQYADVLLPRQVDRVTPVASRPDVRRIFLPPVGGFKTFSGIAQIGIGYAAFVSLEALAVPVEMFLPASTRPIAFVLGTVSIIAGVIWLLTGKRRIAFEIDPFALRMSRTGPLGLRQFTWARSDIRDVHHHRFNGRLVVSLKCRDPAEIYVGSNQEQSARVVEEVNAALTAVPQGASAPKPAAADPDAGLSSPRTRAVLFSISIVMTLAAFAGLLFRGARRCARPARP